MSHPQHTTGPAPPPPADQASPTTARPLGETSTSNTPARTVRLVGPSRGSGAAGAAGALEPPRADLPSCWQERAAERAARRYPPMPQHHPGSISTPPQGAATGDRGDPAPPGRGENLRPEEPPDARNLQPTAPPSPTRRRTLRGPVPTREQHHPLTPPRTGQATDSHQDSPAQPTSPETPINHPAPHANVPTRA